MRSRHIRTYKFDRLVRRVSVKVIACMSIEKLIERANDIEDMLQEGSKTPYYTNLLFIQVVRDQFSRTAYMCLFISNDIFWLA
jgi:hypothetical protein